MISMPECQLMARKSDVEARVTAMLQNLPRLLAEHLPRYGRDVYLALSDSSHLQITSGKRYECDVCRLADLDREYIFSMPHVPLDILRYIVTAILTEDTELHPKREIWAHWMINYLRRTSNELVFGCLSFALAAYAQNMRCGADRDPDFLESLASSLHEAVQRVNLRHEFSSLGFAVLAATLSLELDLPFHTLLMGTSRMASEFKYLLAPRCAQLWLDLIFENLTSYFDADIHTFDWMDLCVLIRHMLTMLREATNPLEWRLSMIWRILRNFGLIFAYGPQPPIETAFEASTRSTVLQEALHVLQTLQITVWRSNAAILVQFTTLQAIAAAVLPARSLCQALELSTPELTDECQNESECECSEAREVNEGEVGISASDEVASRTHAVPIPPPLTTQPDFKAINQQLKDMLLHHVAKLVEELSANTERMSGDGMSKDAPLPLETSQDVMEKRRNLSLKAIREFVHEEHLCLVMANLIPIGLLDHHRCIVRQALQTMHMLCEEPTVVMTCFQLALLPCLHVLVLLDWLIPEYLDKDAQCDLQWLISRLNEEVAHKASKLELLTNVTLHEFTEALFAVCRNDGAGSMRHVALNTLPPMRRRVERMTLFATLCEAYVHQYVADFLVALLNLVQPLEINPNMAELLLLTWIRTTKSPKWTPFNHAPLCDALNTKCWNDGALVSVHPVSAAQAYYFLRRMDVAPSKALMWASSNASFESLTSLLAHEPH